MTHRRIWSVLVWALVATAVHAADVPVAARKLSLVAKFSDFLPRESVVFTAKDLGVTKGAGIDPDAISVRFDVEYGNYHGKGEWSVAAGTANGWLANGPLLAKYIHPGDPLGDPEGVKKVIVKPGKLLKLVAKRLGRFFEEIDPHRVGDPLGPVYTAYCVTNGAEDTCHCTQFPTCVWKEISGGLGAKLVCKGGTGDATCRAVCSDVVDQGLTAVDACSGLEWEKKDTAVGSGVDAANLHDVDNRYTWSGRCTLDASVLCQPTAAAAARCATETGGALGCDECGVGEGICDATADGAITTVWDWLDELDAAAFAGHADWRLPTGIDGFGGSLADPPAELASLADDSSCSVGDWCLPPALGPAAVASYWSSATGPSGTVAIGAEFLNTVFGEPYLGELSNGLPKASGIGAARAVRSEP